MLEHFIKQIEELKSEFHTNILELPQNPDINIINESPSCFTVKSSWAWGNSLLPLYYDFKKQYELVVEKLESVAIDNYDDTLNSIVETGIIRLDKRTLRLNPTVVKNLKSIL